MEADEGEISREDCEVEESRVPVNEAAKKQQEDALWASFLSAVGQKPKASAAEQSTSAQKGKVREKLS